MVSDAESAKTENIRRLREISGHLVDPEVATAVFELLPDAIIVVDSDARIQLVNRQTEFLFGYHRKELFDQHVNMLLPEEFRERHLVHLSQYMNEPRMRPMGLRSMDLRGRKKDGSVFVAEINLSPLSTEFGILVAAVIRRKREDAE